MLFANFDLVKNFDFGMFLVTSYQIITKVSRESL